MTVLKILILLKKEILIFCDPYYSYSPDELHLAQKITMNGIIEKTSIL